MGKFYELFHIDATIGVKELGLLYMKVRLPINSKHHSFGVLVSPASSFAFPGQLRPLWLP